MHGDPKTVGLPSHLPERVGGRVWRSGSVVLASLNPTLDVRLIGDRVGANEARSNGMWRDGVGPAIALALVKAIADADFSVAD
jgi:hypothetical protein